MRRVGFILAVSLLAMIVSPVTPAFGDDLRVAGASTRTDAVAVLVHVPGPGRVVVSGMRGSELSLTPAARVVRSGSSVVVKVPMTSSLQRRLARGSVVVCIAVRFRAADGSTQTTSRDVRLKRFSPKPSPVTG